MTRTEFSSYESWTLMALIYRELDDGDYKNALQLSERLYAIDKNNAHYKYLYAKCLFNLLDYTASYTILKADRSTPCLNYFAKSCLELGNMEETQEEQRKYWQEGAEAIMIAVNNEEVPNKVHWGDELASVNVRHHMPSKATLFNLLGDLYVKLDNIRAAAMYYWKCLSLNPYKISGYISICDIAPDIADLKKTTVPRDVFLDFNTSTIDLSRSPNFYSPPSPIPDVVDIMFMEDDYLPTNYKNGFSMPEVQSDYQDITVKQLRSLVKFSPKIVDDGDELITEEYDRGDIEKKKDIVIESIESDIKRMKASEAYKNKHGLHKKPPVQPPQRMKVELKDDGTEGTENYQEIYKSLQNNTMSPRLSYKRRSGSLEDELASTTAKKHKFALKSTNIISSSHTITDLTIVQSKQTDYLPLESRTLIVNGMNKVIKVLSIVASGYMYQTSYYCAQAALELQKLDDQQYDSPRVLCLLGRAYYDAGDYQSARLFFQHAFVTAPWFCEGVPIYSTCLWYLNKETELNLLAFKMKNNRSHLFEAYVAAGNWCKSVNRSNDAARWFQKAVETNSASSYGHALLGYEEWEKGNYLGAKQYFAKSMTTNRRSYIGWYGMGVSYQGMEEYTQAVTLLSEAARLHPHHPVTLATMSEVLFELGNYRKALTFIDKSLNIRRTPTNEKFRAKIAEKVEEEEREGLVVD